MNRRFTILFSLLLAAALLAGCSTLKAQPAGLADEEVRSIAENILLSIDSGNYNAFIKDFSDTMKSAFPETEFEKVRELLTDTSGKFISLSEPVLSNSEGYARYTFPCKYEKEDLAALVVFAVGGSQVEGLFFDSQNIRKLGK
jgi:hypothetical protein